MTAASALTAALIIGISLTVIGFFGPALLRHAAPALAKTPRLAATLLVGGILVWPTTLLALSLALAWVLAGPALLPQKAALVCEQCLTAANPFSVESIQTALPTVLLLAVPTVIAAMCTVGIAAQFLALVRCSRSTAARVQQEAYRRPLLGYNVSVVHDHRPWALTFSPRLGGITLSSGAIDQLADDELEAVLAHEQAHMDQRHHIVTAWVDSIAAQLRWVPFIREAAEVLPDYLEIAADQQACRKVNTTALVRALLVLGEKKIPTGTIGSAAGTLFAAGPRRIPHLVGSSTGRKGYVPALAAGSQILLLGFVSVIVLLSYAIALLTGCSLP
ncbi:Zn-dependent protease [Corynebacterium glutamicum]|uniref:M56 family metallopeptidase n=1 Tax=Corynebacterium glutamicum TaxID=1718 RepID=UPI0009451119|nr:M56 family metallopeptidase [Corynebacterium glutamicum]OKX95478.1 Zn-dependent protease [Corynebacterium glutamicum]